MINKTALIADQSETFLMYLSILLGRLKFEVIPVTSIRDALKLSKISKPNMSMLEVAKPETECLAVMKIMKDHHELSAMPVFAVSTISDKRIMEKCIQLGCHCYLTKPIVLKDLHEAIESSDIFSRDRYRKYIRAEFSNEVAVSYKGKSRKYRAVDISAGGIFITSNSPLPVGAEVKLRLGIEESQSVSLKGKIIYTKGFHFDKIRGLPGMAIEFKEMSDRKRKALDRYAANLLVGDIISKQKEEVVSIDKVS